MMLLILFYQPILIIIFFAIGKTLEIPEKLRPISDLSSGKDMLGIYHHFISYLIIFLILAARPRAIADVIDVVSLSSTPIARKRKAALEQGNVLKKIKNKQY